MKKVIIFDPVCGIYKGHNLPTIYKYAQWLTDELGYECEAWTALKSQPASTNLPFVTVPWVYGYWLYENLSIKEETKARKRAIKNESLLQISRNIAHHNSAQRKIETSLSRALAKSPDFIFFPGADFYSLTSILEQAKKKKIPNETKLVIRLMGVMEWATKLPRAREIIDQVLFDIKVLLGERAIFTAETEKYAFEISMKINDKVIVTSIPNKNTINGQSTLRQPSNPKTITLACLGGARADKGYFDLLNICAATHNKFNKSPLLEVKFTIQSMNPNNFEYDWNYQTELSRLPNTKLIKPRLSDEELNFEISSADIIFLPYSVGTYCGRGSAILFDSLDFGKPMLGTSGTGFGDTIMHAGLGLTYNGIEDYYNRLSDLINLKPEKLMAIKDNQAKYSQKLLNNLKECFK